MDFDEPDLEELIQNDLRSEMNKILSQSEVEELEAAAKHQSPFEPGTSSRNPSYGYRAEMVIKREVDESEMLHGAFDVMEATSLQELDQHEQTPQRHQEISGHFSVGSYTNFLNELGHLPPGITEHGDLQSLTWLTTVDVQALQKLTEQGTIGTTAIQAAQQEAIQAHAQAQGITPEQQSVIQMVQMANLQDVSQANGTSGNHQPDPNITSSCTSPRYMPIEPNLSPESRRFLAQQRYHLHGHPGGGPIGRHSFDASQSGPRRYIPGHVMGHHPYPPPPYTTGGGPYMHGVPLMHHRYQHPVQQQKVYPKPVYSYSCLIAMALCNSKTGCLPVSEIYHFMTENYPYFKTAPDGWKNSVRHNLSLNKCFEKVEKPNTSQRKGCLWALNPAKIAKMKEEVQKWKRKDPDSIRRSMSNPEELDRELEEIRRADEEAARRRMLSLSSHGLTAQSFHGHHQHHPARFLPIHPPVVSHMNTPVLGPPSHPSTSRRRAGLHFSTELAQQNFALTLARSAFQPAPTRANPYDLTLHGSSLSQGSIASTSFNVGSNNNNNSNPDMGTGTDMIVLTPSGGKLAFFASPHSASSTSSSNTGLLGTFADCTAGLCVEEDFDASLADIAGLHDPFWDAPHDPEPGISREIGETFSENEGTRSVLPSEVQEYSPSVSSDGQIRLPPVIQMLSSTQSEQPSPDTPDFKTTTSQRMDNFGRDMSHFANNSIKPVVML